MGSPSTHDEMADTPTPAAVTVDADLALEMRRQPVACTLSPDQRRCNASDLLPGLSARARSSEWTSDGIRFTFAAHTTTLEAIAKAIESERRCCAFLTFRLVVPEGAGDFVLELTGPPGTREFLEDLGLGDKSPHMGAS